MYMSIRIYYSVGVCKLSESVVKSAKSFANNKIKTDNKRKSFSVRF